MYLKLGSSGFQFFISLELTISSRILGVGSLQESREVIGGRMVPIRQSANQNGAEIRTSTVWPSVVPSDAQSECPNIAQIFAYGA